MCLWYIDDDVGVVRSVRERDIERAGDPRDQINDFTGLGGTQSKLQSAGLFRSVNCKAG